MDLGAVTLGMEKQTGAAAAVQTTPVKESTGVTDRAPVIGNVDEIIPPKQPDYVGPSSTAI